jgi:hypothetical protein
MGSPLQFSISNFFQGSHCFGIVGRWWTICNGHFRNVSKEQTTARFNGQNRRSVIVMGKLTQSTITESFHCTQFSFMQYLILEFFLCLSDNHPLHHVQEIVDLIYNSGVIVRYLPPYSPDLNPIEECFSVVKHYIRQNDLVFQSLTNPEPLIWDAFGHLTSDFCQGFMRHAGYL